MEVTMVTGY